MDTQLIIGFGTLVLGGLILYFLKDMFSSKRDDDSKWRSKAEIEACGLSSAFEFDLTNLVGKPQEDLFRTLKNKSKLKKYKDDKLLVVHHTYTHDEKKGYGLLIRKQDGDDGGAKDGSGWKAMYLIHWHNKNKELRYIQNDYLEAFIECVLQDVTFDKASASGPLVTWQDLQSAIHKKIPKNDQMKRYTDSENFARNLYNEMEKLKCGSFHLAGKRASSTRTHHKIKIGDYEKQPRDERKIGAVLPVFKERKPMEAIEEAWLFEKALQKCDYEIYFGRDRKSMDDQPVSYEAQDLMEFWSYVNEKREFLDGVFIMVIAHGFTDKQGRPCIITQDDKTFDILEGLRSFGHTSFPLIFCINSCRTQTDIGGSFQISQMVKIPPQMFLSWSTHDGQLAYEKNFVTEWRKTLQDLDNFEQKHIATVASEVQMACGGNYYNGLTSKFPCKYGVFEKGTLVPSFVQSKRRSMLIKSAKEFVRKKVALSKVYDAVNAEDFENEDKWQICGSPQGEKVLLIELNEIVVVFLDSDDIVNGVISTNLPHATSNMFETWIRRMKFNGKRDGLYFGLNEFEEQTTSKLASEETENSCRCM